MRTGSWLVTVAVLLAGCFEEGGDTAKAKAIESTVQGLIAFGDIHSNIETDPGKAGEALLEFLKWPVSADQIVSPPFSDAETVMDASPRLAPTLPVPDCLLQTGEPACDTYSTTDTCEAGGFTFRGVMSRRCSKCDDPRSLCFYGWRFPELKYTSDKFKLTMATSGSWAGKVGQVKPNLSAAWKLDVLGSERDGVITACACTTFTVIDSPTASGKPRKLVNSSFVVRAQVANKERCGLVSFDGAGNPTVTSSCECGDGSVCRAPKAEVEDPPILCGDGDCSPGLGENYDNCPVDCNDFPTVCGDASCDLGESRINCPADCSGEAP